MALVLFVPRQGQRNIDKCYLCMYADLARFPRSAIVIPRGGIYKNAADRFETKDNRNSDRRMALHDAPALLEFGRRELTRQQDLIAKKGDGV